MTVSRWFLIFMVALVIFLAGWTIGVASANVEDSGVGTFHAESSLKTSAVPAPVIPDPSSFGAATLYEAARVTAFLEAEAERIAEARRSQTQQAQVPARTTGAYSSGSSCHGRIISNATAMRESGCDYNAYNPTGCDGRGCIGYYQLHRMHYDPNGVCADLDTSPAGQDACAARLPASAW